MTVKQQLGTRNATWGTVIKLITGPVFGVGSIALTVLAKYDEWREYWIGKKPKVAARWLETMACKDDAVAVQNWLVSPEGLRNVKKVLAVRGSNNFTALHFAARHGSEKVAKLLTEAGADKDAKDSSGKTPAHYATIYGHNATLALLGATAVAERSPKVDGKSGWAKVQKATKVVGLSAKLADLAHARGDSSAELKLFADALPPESAINEEELVVGGYLAEGAFGTVNRGLYHGQRVALKQLKIDTDKLDAMSLLVALREEVSICLKLRHPNLAAVIGATTNPLKPTIVLEYLDGTLYDAIVDPKSDTWAYLPQLDLMPMFRDIACGMAYLHTRPAPILHRDLKPPNVLILKGSVGGIARLKLADFGTAVELPDARAMRTDCIGSAAYMAPEVEKDLPHGLPCDVFSFGATLYEIFYMIDTGENFDCDDGMFAAMDYLRTPICSTPSEMPEQPKSCEEHLWGLICSCLQADPERRPAFTHICLELGRIEDAIGDNVLTRWLVTGK